MAGEPAEHWAEHADKERVVVLPSGLQYKVLREGRGTDHPNVGTPCECHYKGQLLDGTEFDSSYKRGTPTTFAPNQVIKGWTEAMQLMVEGDKWEMYIPWEMAYGKNGKPPKIPAEAPLVFVMEIMKIKGATKPKVIDFPEWTEEQLKLWEPKDEEALEKWRVVKEKSWADGKLKEQYPTREDFDAWLKKQCTSAQNKSLWKRTRTNYETDAGDKSEKKEQKPAMTKETARELLTTAIDTFKQPDNVKKLEGLMKECEGVDAAQAPMMKMMKLMPAVKDMMGGPLQKHGFSPDDMLSVVMQIQGFGAQDPSIATDCGKLMKAVQGDISELLA